MKVSIYEQLVRAGATRRDVLKGAASMAALAAASTGTLGALTRPAAAQDAARGAMQAVLRLELRELDLVRHEPLRVVGQAADQVGNPRIGVGRDGSGGHAVLR